MCGITGLYLEKGTIDPIKLDGAAQTLTHRGPDNSDSFVDGSFGMAHTRLSIIDLSGGDQPLFARNKELILIANGKAAIGRPPESRDGCSRRVSGRTTSTTSIPVWWRR